MKHRSLWTAAAAASVVFLIVMVVTGALPGQRQLVKFEAKGLMKLEPDLISRVEIEIPQQRAVLMRGAGGGWAANNGEAVSEDLARKISLAVQFMNTAGPIRVIAADEIPGIKLADFGLEPPRLHVVLNQDAQAVIGVRFGSHNPEDTAQYLIVDGHGELILMSRFVGQEWESVAGALFAK
jgi:hypothetical protein